MYHCTNELKCLSTMKGGSFLPNDRRVYDLWEGRVASLDFSLTIESEAVSGDLAQLFCNFLVAQELHQHHLLADLDQILPAETFEPACIFYGKKSLYSFLLCKFLRSELRVQLPSVGRLAPTLQSVCVRRKCFTAMAFFKIVKLYQLKFIFPCYSHKPLAAGYTSLRILSFGFVLSFETAAKHYAPPPPSLLAVQTGFPLTNM